MKEAQSNHRPGPFSNARDSRSSDAITPSVVGESRFELPTIDREPPPIRVGAGGPLVVPREDTNAAIEPDDELELAGMIAKKIRKPARREWIVVDPTSELPTTVLPHRPKADGIEEEFYYVAPNLRGPIRDALKPVRVLVYFSLLTRRHALWIVKATVGNTWYESLAAMLKQPPEFFARNAIRVASDRDHSAYRVFYKPTKLDVPWPTEPTDALLGEALGPSHFITTSDHPLYVELTEGEELT